MKRGVNRNAASGIWHFNQNEKDYSAYGNTGSSSSPLFASGISNPVSGSALQLDGTSEMTVAIPDASSMQFVSTDFSFEMCVKPTLIDSPRRRVISKAGWPNACWNKPSLTGRANPVQKTDLQAGSLQ